MFAEHNQFFLWAPLSSFMAAWLLVSWDGDERVQRTLSLSNLSISMVSVYFGMGSEAEVWEVLIKI